MEKDKHQLYPRICASESIKKPKTLMKIQSKQIPRENRWWDRQAVCTTRAGKGLGRPSRKARFPSGQEWGRINLGFLKLREGCME